MGGGGALGTKTQEARACSLKPKHIFGQPILNDNLLLEKSETRYRF